MRHLLLIAVATMSVLFVRPQSGSCQEVLFGVTFNEQLIRIDAGTGEATLVGNLQVANADAIGISTFNGELYVLDQVSDQLIVVNPLTAATIRTVAVQDTTTFGVFSEGDFEIRSNGGGYYMESDARFNQVDITTGAWAQLGTSSPLNIDGLAFASSGTLYGLQSSGDLFTVNPNDGIAQLVGGSGATYSGGFGGLDFRSDGVLFAAGNSTIYQIVPGTGARTIVGDGNSGFSSISGITFMVIPEPGSAALFAAALGALFVRRRSTCSRT